MYTNSQQRCWRCSRCYKETLISLGDNNICSNCGPELPNLSVLTPNLPSNPHSPTFHNNETSHRAYLPNVQLQPITHLFSSHEDSHLPFIQNCLPPISSSPFSFSSSSLPSSLSQLPSLSAPSHSYPSSMPLQSSVHPTTLPNISSLSLPLLPPRNSFYSLPSPLPSSPSLFSSSSQSNLSSPSPLISSAFPLENNQSLTSSSSSSTSSQSLHRVLQTVHLQHIQRLIEIQRDLHSQTQFQNPTRSSTPYHPYSRSQPPYIARIINEINNVMHNHSIQHFQMLTQSLQNPRPNNNDAYYPANIMPDNEMTQEYSQFLADLFERQHHSGPPPTDKSEISKLPQIIFTEEDIKDEKQCAVCKDMFEEADTALELPCGHPYHLDCILPWLKTRNTCPCCRYQLKPEIDPDIENSDSEYEIIDTDSEFSSDDGSDNHYDYC